jgi:hypothetical protein
LLPLPGPPALNYTPGQAAKPDQGLLIGVPATVGSEWEAALTKRGSRTTGGEREFVRADVDGVGGRCSWLTYNPICTIAQCVPLGFALVIPTDPSRVRPSKFPTPAYEFI